MKQTISLNGAWKLYYFANQHEDVDSPMDLPAAKAILATVPGNVECDLAAAGMIPKDLYKGLATEENEKFEPYTWWYEKAFSLPQTTEGDRIYLKFGAVDCLAEYFINGRKVYASENAFQEIRFEITDFVNRDKENVLHVHLRSAMEYVFRQRAEQYLACWHCGPQSFVRKPAHAFGWDIFPRAVSAGIWRDVALEVNDGIGFADYSCYTLSADETSARLVFYADLEIPYSEFKKGVSIRVYGKCKDHEFEQTESCYRFKTCSFFVDVKNPRLWWPYGYGEANVYDIIYELLVGGEVKAKEHKIFGIRTVRLQRTDTVMEPNHCFKFVVNGVDVMCKGSNWVPLDAYHSKDKVKYQKALALFTDTHCNILRVWGGGVYEQEEFYEYCDRHGIMIWQDFMMACIPVSMDEKMLSNIRDEAVWAVKTLRHHPSIVLWSGDNEIDETNAAFGRRPGMNKVSRQLLPEVIERHDTGRPYLASSPYLPDSCFDDYLQNDSVTERHLWGSRDYFKADFYKQSNAHFVSETGYHGCPNLESIKKIVDEDYVWPIFNKQWSLHSSDQNGSLSRVQLMWDQIKQLFDFEPQNIEDFILASQISQAEAKKFFIERVRVHKPYTSGVIWWNMLDGWPQMSDAVVDYFFEKKLAYHYIKRSQNPFVLMIDEMRDWTYTLVASNDTLREVSGNYKVFDLDTGETLAQDCFNVRGNANKSLANVPMFYPEKRFLVIEWKIDDNIYYNHYLCGMPAFDFKQYKGWLERFNKIVRPS